LLIYAAFTTAWLYLDNGVEPPLLPDVTNDPAGQQPGLVQDPKKLVRQKGLGDPNSSDRSEA
jgi:hypothetical protein